MYKIPLTTSPNQTFTCNIPVNGENVRFKFFLSYNDQAEYWLMTLTRLIDNLELLTNIPLLASQSRFADTFCQLDYLRIGFCIIAPTSEEQNTMPNDTNLGQTYLMIWGDNSEY